MKRLSFFRHSLAVSATVALATLSLPAAEGTVLAVPGGAPLAANLPVETAIQVSPGEHSEYRWLPFAEAAQQVFSWTNRDALQRLMQSRTQPPVTTGST